MENNQPKTSKYALNYGMLLGLISIVFFLILYFMDLHYQGGIPVLVVSLVIQLGVILAALRAFKTANGGYMSLAEGLKIGVGLCLIGGIIGIIFSQILANVIDPDMMQKQLEIARADMADRGLNQEQIEAQMEMAKKFQKPWIQAAFALIGSLFFGFILTLIPALVMKKSESEY
ncbi:DUF4199 domain-containing protein [Robertkochia aurantiaca]|uniref:DUF4199 domain-containing protein n=1 Tax=Robertkochia aurantiaca TaxID=2873700 RepID=UPI001CCAAB27|nr:DUF4199 domain-containing protein [Robertkochia sp. 3YJGBD-33]